MKESTLIISDQQKTIETLKTIVAGQNEEIATLKRDLRILAGQLEAVKMGVNPSRAEIKP